jgi:sugar O-acyltransferase (sialic acid O-acetyltransferase NeuD family)
MENPVIIFGAKGIGQIALDIFSRNGVVVYGILDDDTSLHNSEFNDIGVLGSTDDDGFLKLIGKKCEAFVAIEDRAVRKNLVEMLNDRRHVMPVNAIHESALVSKMALLGHGNLMAARSVLSAMAAIGNHCLIQTAALIEHNAVVGDYVNLGAGSVIGAGAIIENDVFIGSGAVIVAGVRVGKGASVGAGAVVVADVAAKSRVFGNPAAKV